MYKLYYLVLRVWIEDFSDAYIAKLDQNITERLIIIMIIMIIN